MPFSALGSETWADFPIQKYLRDVYTFLHGFSTTEVALLIGAPTVDKG